MIKRLKIDDVLEVSIEASSLLLLERDVFSFYF